MDKVINPHDKYFKSSMSDMRVARSFIQSHLPKNVLERMDLATLKQRNETFIDEALGKIETDIVYSAKLADKTAYIYILVEHQSTPQKFMPLRLWRYVLRLMFYHVEKLQNKSLPIVVPLIFYNGKEPYTHSTDIFDLFDDRKLAESNFLKPFQLMDLNHIPDEQIRQHQWASIMEFVMKHPFSDETVKFLDVLVATWKVKDEIGGEAFIETTLCYIINKSQGRSLDYLKQLLEQTKLTGIGEKIMLLTDIIRQEGRAEGATEATRRMVAGMLKSRVDYTAISEISGLPLNEIKLIEQQELITE